MLSKEFGWTQQDIMDLDQDYYDDCVNILSTQAKLQEKEQKKSQRKWPRTTK